MGIEVNEKAVKFLVRDGTYYTSVCLGEEMIWDTDYCITLINIGAVSTFIHTCSNLVLDNAYANLHVSSGGTATSNIITSGASIYVSSGGMANMTVMYGAGYMWVEGTANSTTLEPSLDMQYVGGGSMNIMQGGTANSIKLLHSCHVYVSSGGTANNADVDAAGNMSILSGGTANDPIIRFAGSMYVSSGGTALNVVSRTAAVIIAEPGAYITYA